MSCTPIRQGPVGWIAEHVLPPKVIACMGWVGDENPEVSPSLVRVAVTHLPGGTVPAHCQVPSLFVVVVPRGISPCAGWAAVCTTLVKISTMHDGHAGLVVPFTLIRLT